MDDDRQKKNMDKIRKQDMFKFFKGKVQMQRGKKPDLQPKETNNELPSQEVMDQMRYIGGKVFTDPDEEV